MHAEVAAARSWAVLGAVAGRRLRTRRRSNVLQRDARDCRRWGWHLRRLRTTDLGSSCTWTRPEVLLRLRRKARLEPAAQAPSAPPPRRFDIFLSAPRCSAFTLTLGSALTQRHASRARGDERPVGIGERPTDADRPNQRRCDQNPAPAAARLLILVKSLACSLRPSRHRPADDEMTVCWNGPGSERLTGGLVVAQLVALLLIALLAPLLRGMLAADCSRSSAPAPAAGNDSPAPEAGVMRAPATGHWAGGCRQVTRRTDLLQEPPRRGPCPRWPKRTVRPSHALFPYVRRLLPLIRESISSRWAQAHPKAPTPWPTLVHWPEPGRGARRSVSRRRVE